MTREDLKKCLDLEFRQYFPTKVSYLKSLLLRERGYYIWKYQKALRLLEYYKAHMSIHGRIKYAYYSRKVNKLGLKLGVECWHSVFDEGLLLYHTAGGIVINTEAKVGKNCHLHGNNCIGNNGGSETGCPKIGDNCEIGVGASIIGDIRLGNNITIGAGAVVINSCIEDGAVLAGVPAKIIRIK